MLGLRRALTAGLLITIILGLRVLSAWHQLRKRYMSRVAWLWGKAYGAGLFTRGAMSNNKEKDQMAATVPAKKPVKAPAPKLKQIEIIRMLAEASELPNKQVAGLFKQMVELATSETKKNGEFTLPGFGKLVKAQRAARTGRNPQTGEAIKIEAKTTVRFRLSKTLKDAIAPPVK